MVRSIRYSGAKKNGDMKSLSDGVVFQVACFRINVIALEGVGGAGGKEARKKGLDEFVIDRANIKRPTIPAQDLPLDCFVRANVQI